MNLKEYVNSLPTGKMEDRVKTGKYVEPEIKEEIEPYLNRKTRRKYGLKGINSLQTESDKLKEIAVIEKIKKFL